MKFASLAMMICVVLLVAGCETRNSCDWATPLRPSAQDVLTQGTVEQIVLHNTLGERLCGWRP